MWPSFYHCRSLFFSVLVVHPSDTELRAPLVETKSKHIYFLCLFTFVLHSHGDLRFRNHFCSPVEHPLYKRRYCEDFAIFFWKYFNEKGNGIRGRTTEFHFQHSISFIFHVVDIVLNKTWTWLFQRLWSWSYLVSLSAALKSLSFSLLIQTENSLKEIQQN